MMDSRQKLTPPRPGAPMTADRVGHIIAVIKRMLVQGPGVLIEPMGDQIKISAKKNPIPAGGGASTVPGATAGRFRCPSVDALPAVPTAANTFQMVYWTSEGDGTGDDGVWWTRTDLTRWYPFAYSTLNGTPGAEELT